MKQTAIITTLAFVGGLGLGNLLNQAKVMADDPVETIDKLETISPSKPSQNPQWKTKLSEANETIETLRQEKILLQDKIAELTVKEEAESKTYTPIEDTPELRTALAGEYFEELGMDDQLGNAIAASFKHILPKNDDLDEKFQEDVQELMKEFLAWERYESTFYDIYAETFTANELQKILDFQRSSIGRLLVEKSPTLTEKTMKKMGDLMKDGQADLNKKLEALMEESKKRQKNISH